MTMPVVPEPVKKMSDTQVVLVILLIIAVAAVAGLLIANAMKPDPIYCEGTEQFVRDCMNGDL